MAEYKTAEQYVVAELELTKLLLEQERDNHEKRMLGLTIELEKTQSLLVDAHKLIDFIRNKVYVEKHAGTQFISFSSIWETYDEDDFNYLVHELGLEVPNNKEEEENA